MGSREATNAELLLPFFTETVRGLLAETKLYCGARWLMIPVTTKAVLQDVKQLIELRVQKRQNNG